MKFLRIVAALAFAAVSALSSPAQAANSTVSAMSAAATLTGAELLYCVQGAADHKCTPLQMSAYIFGLASGDCTITTLGVVTCLKTNGTAFGTAAVQNTGTSGATLPFANGTNTWSAATTFSSTLTLTGLTTGTQVSCLGLTAANLVALSSAACGAGGGGGSGTVTSVGAGCGTSTSGSPITTSGTIISTEAITIRTTGNYVTADCGTLVQYNSASDQTPTLPTTAASGAGLYFDTCSIQHSQTITATGSNTIGGATTYVIGTGTAAAPVCVKLVSDGGSSPGDWKPIPMTGGGGGGGTGANPTATAGPTAVNGSATTFLRSDGAPAIQKATSGQFGIVEVDGTSITAASGVISATATGTVTSISGGCGASTSGSPITTTGTISAVEPITIRTSGNYATGDCGTIVQYNSATDQTPTLPTSSSAGAGFYFETCSIQHLQTITRNGSDTIGGSSATYLLRTGTATLPTCVKLIADGASPGDWKIVPIQGATQVFVQPIETAATLSGCNGSTATINLTLGTYFSCTVSTGATTFAVSNPAASGLVSSFTLELTNPGSQTLTFMSGTKWPGGSPPTFTTSGVDLIVCSTRDGATTWRCVQSEKNSS